MRSPCLGKNVQQEIIYRSQYSGTVLSLAGYFGRLNMYWEFASDYKLQFLVIGLCNLFYFGLTRKKFGYAIAILSLANRQIWIT